MAERDGRPGRTRALLSSQVSVWMSRTTIATGVVGVLLGLVIIVSLLTNEENPTSEVPPNTSGSTTTIPTFDVDRDGDIDYALIEDEVVAVPTGGDSSDGLEIWLPFLGTILAAIVGGGALVAVARLNRAGGEQVADLAERLSRLEHLEEGDEA